MTKKTGRVQQIEPGLWRGRDGRLRVKLPADLVARLDREARKTGRSRADIVHAAVEQWGARTA